MREAPDSIHKALKDLGLKLVIIGVKQHVVDLPPFAFYKQVKGSTVTARTREVTAVKGVPYIAVGRLWGWASWPCCFRFVEREGNSC